jgi:hypothetical protein
MATLVLSAAGAAFGGSLGGSLFGLSSLVIGKAVGATVGSLIDQRLLGAGAAPVETGRVDRLRVMGSSEGAPLPRCFGRIRVPGQLIWSSRFLESVSTQRVGGKGSRRGRQTVREYGYSISLALALCEGEVIRVGRIWADGQPVAQAGLTWRLHTGSEDQLPDPLIVAIEGEENAPAYRGTAYVVIEDLELAPFGNRIPQLNFEVFRAPAPKAAGLAPAPSRDIRAIALVPGTGEYALATIPVTLERARGNTIVTNVNNDRGVPDFVCSFDQLTAELPGCEAVSLVVSWFGDDLRAGHCSLYPAVDQGDIDGSPMPWRVAGLERAAAPVVSRVEDRPLFGGTPSDASVVQAIRHMADAGQAVMFYPFILMDILEGSGRPDLPAVHPALRASLRACRRGRVLLRGVRDAGAHADPGTRATAFRRSLPSGNLPRRCGDTRARCEDRLCGRLVGILRIPAAGRVGRRLLPPRPVLGGRERRFHRDRQLHAAVGLADDRSAGRRHLGQRLQPRLPAGEHRGRRRVRLVLPCARGREAQLRTPITDGAYGEPWVFRYKDLRSWWSEPHHDRIGGVRQEMPTAWVPRSKPFRFTPRSTAGG